MLNPALFKQQTTLAAGCPPPFRVGLERRHTLRVDRARVPGAPLATVYSTERATERGGGGVYCYSVGVVVHIRKGGSGGGGSGVHRLG